MPDLVDPVGGNAMASAAPDLSNEGIRAWWERFGTGAFSAIMAAELSEEWTASPDHEALEGIGRLCELGARNPAGCAEILADDSNLLRLRKILAALPAALRIRVMQYLAEAEALPPGRLARLMDEEVTAAGSPSALDARVLTQSILAMHRSWLLSQIFNAERRKLVMAAVASTRPPGRRPAGAQGGNA